MTRKPPVARSVWAVRALVTAAAAIVAAGAVPYLFGSWSAPVDYRVFHGEASPYRTIAGTLKSAASLDARGVIQLGILLLIAIPGVRVAALSVSFLRRRDWRYVAMSLVVLAALLFSYFGSAAAR